MAYREDLAEISSISFDKILKIARDNVPAGKKDNPWIGLNHGVKLLDNDDELVQYIAAYGSMHREKLDIALDTIQNLQDFFTKNITIIDWGCGQGLATMCFYDYMRKRGIEPAVDRIILIEPSIAALNRAQEHLSKYTTTADISTINKYINDLKFNDISISGNTLVLHFFSNILDIESVDLDQLTNLIKNGINTEQLFFCVGPKNTGASRIAEFAKLFDIADKDLIGSHAGFLKGRGTISMIVFRIQSNIPEIIKVEFYPLFTFMNHNNIALKRVLKNLTPIDSPFEKVLQFYQAVIALEQMKSGRVRDVYYYPYEYELDSDQSLKLKIDIQDNKDFEQLFIQNLNVKWPRHLSIGIGLFWNNKIYRILECIYPFEDLKSIDITKEYISVDLSMFIVSAEEADELELTDSMVNAIVDVLTDRKSTLQDLESILKDAIGHSLTLHSQLSLALTEKAPALAQISSELKSLSEKENNSLMDFFLAGNIKDNIIDTVSEDEIINVVNMDDSQRSAIATALNSRISVIAGPPGTGKTQMIANLLANTMLKGKSVLVASKNNKAVDNIKERFDQITDIQYLLRFGSKSVISSQLIPMLDRLLMTLPNIQYDDSALSQNLSNYNRNCVALSEARARLGELIELTDSISKINEDIHNIKKKRESIEEEKHKKVEELHKAYSDIKTITSLNKYDWENFSKETQKNLNILQSKNKGMFKLFFNLFSKRKYTTQILNGLLSLPEEIKEKIEQESDISQFNDVQNCDDLIRLCQIELRYIKRVKKYQKSISDIEYQVSQSSQFYEKQLKEIEQKLAETNRKIQILANAKDELLDKIRHAKEYISFISGVLLNDLVKSRLKEAGTPQAIARYRNYLLNNIPREKAAIAVFLKDARNFINAFLLNSVTSLSVKSAYPLESELFDMVIIDEASQCDVASALPLLYRTKQIVVIGDPLQLRHITPVTAAEERQIKDHLSLGQNPFVRYADYSLWDYCNDLITSADKNNTSIILDCHYRCHPQIIGYSNEIFYQKYLGTTLKVCTKYEDHDLPDSGIVWIDIVGKQKSENRNVNEAEIRKSISLAIHIASEYPHTSIGIISPFRHQAEEINAKIPPKYKEQIIADTVHKFQGDERDVIIYSLVVTDNSPNNKIKWIDTQVPNLVNVAVTRARKVLYVVGNRQYIKEHSNSNLPLGYLIEYTEQKASVTTVRKETVIIDTNIFVDSPNILNEIDFSKQIVIISATVIDELDRLKVTLDDIKKQNAKLAIKNIKRLVDGRKIRMECANMEQLPIDFSRKNPDNMILSVALKHRNQNPILLTSDNGLQLKAECVGIKTKSLQMILNN